MSSSTNECWNACLIIIRITFCSLLFMVVLVTSTVSKMTFLLMTANIFPSTTENSLKTLNGTLSYPLNSTDVRWIWSILITITAPYLITIMKYLWVLMKQNKANAVENTYCGIFLFKLKRNRFNIILYY